MKAVNQQLVDHLLDLIEGINLLDRRLTTLLDSVETQRVLLDQLAGRLRDDLTVVRGKRDMAVRFLAANGIEQVKKGGGERSSMKGGH